MSKANAQPVHQHASAESGFDSQEVGAVAAPPALQLQASTFQLQEAPAEGGGQSTVQERFASHTLTAEDLTDEYVIEQFGNMSTEELFAYRRECTEDTVKAHILTVIDGQDRDPYQSYLGKQFTISDNNAVIRDRAGNAQVYQQGDTIPEGRAVGQNKVIPNGTVIYVTDIVDDLSRVHAEDWGWTSIGNIQGGMFNETLSIDRAEYQSEDANHKTVARDDVAIRSNTPTMGYPAVTPRATIPRNTQVTVVERVAEDRGNVRVTFAGQEVWTRAGNLARTANADGTFTVTDGDAVIRRQSVTYPATGGNLRQGDRMIVLGQSQDTDPVGQYVQVAYTTQDGAGNYIQDADRDAVWTEASGFEDNWADYQSDNAQWVKGRPGGMDGIYLGQMDVVTMIGRDAGSGSQEVEKLSPELLGHYNTLRTQATAAGHDIRLNSGFRSYPKQQALWDANPNRARVAPPGRSNHQNGIAIDINTGGFTTDLYIWMRDNAPALGWVRTVSGEHWHWEQRPADAANGYRLPHVNP